MTLPVAPPLPVASGATSRAGFLASSGRRNSLQTGVIPDSFLTHHPQTSRRVLLSVSSNPAEAWEAGPVQFTAARLSPRW